MACSEWNQLLGADFYAVPDKLETGYALDYKEMELRMDHLGLRVLLRLRPATLLKKRLWHRCFPVNFAKFLRTPFLTEHLWWLLLVFSKRKTSEG